MRENEGGNKLLTPKSKQNPGKFSLLQNLLCLPPMMSRTPTPPVQRKQQWQQVRQDQRQYTAGYQHARFPSTGGHLSSRLGLDVSRLAFGATLRDFTRTPATSPAMEKILDDLLEYDNGLRGDHIVRAFLSPHVLRRHTYFPLCSTEPTVDIRALQGGEILLSWTSSIVFDSNCTTTQLGRMQHGILNLFICYGAMNIHLHWT